MYYITHPKLRNLFFLTMLFIVLGSVLFSILEGWGLIDSLYFTVSTMTTVGYGDLVPTHDVSKLVATGYMVLTVPLILLSVGLTTEVVHDNIKGKIRRKKSKK